MGPKEVTKNAPCVPIQGLVAPNHQRRDRSVPLEAFFQDLLQNGVAGLEDGVVEGAAVPAGTVFGRIVPGAPQNECQECLGLCQCFGDGSGDLSGLLKGHGAGGDRSRVQDNLCGGSRQQLRHDFQSRLGGQRCCGVTSRHKLVVVVVVIVAVVAKDVVLVFLGAAVDAVELARFRPRRVVGIDQEIAPRPRVAGMVVFLGSSESLAAWCLAVLATIGITIWIPIAMLAGSTAWGIAEAMLAGVPAAAAAAPLTSRFVCGGRGRGLVLARGGLATAVTNVVDVVVAVLDRCRHDGFIEHHAVEESVDSGVLFAGPVLLLLLLLLLLCLLLSGFRLRLSLGFRVGSLRKQIVVLAVFW
mmetsp:Transcript_8421/g.24905  ORF Transcript_8421/g.24905 Transcript_8421/m.24905 type:complete len:357 (+) Transcript_8421:2512-3582(+)